MKILKVLQTIAETQLAYVPKDGDESEYQKGVWDGLEMAYWTIVEMYNLKEETHVKQQIKKNGEEKARRECGESS